MLAAAPWICTVVFLSTLFLAIIGASVLFQGSGILHPESASFMRNYLSDTPWLQKIYYWLPITLIITLWLMRVLSDWRKKWTSLERVGSPASLALSLTLAAAAGKGMMPQHSLLGPRLLGSVSF